MIHLDKFLDTEQNRSLRVKIHGEANVPSSPIYLKMNEPQPVRRVAPLHRECRLSYSPRAIIVLFASVLRKCPVREDVNPISERRKRSGRGIRHRRSNLAVNIIFYLCNISIFLLLNLFLSSFILMI